MTGRKIFKELRPDTDISDLIVHHINGDRSKNTPNNLIAVTRKDHRRIHIYFGGFRPIKKRQDLKEVSLPEKLEIYVNLYNYGIYI